MKNSIEIEKVENGYVVNHNDLLGRKEVAADFESLIHIMEHVFDEDAGLP